MNTNIQALQAGCDALAMPYRVLHQDGNLVQVTVNGQPFVFCNWSTPINSQALARLCEDKAYAYEALSSSMRMPRTVSFLDPGVAPHYQRYVRFPNQAAVGREISEQFGLPVVVKRNRGSHGSNVFKVTTASELSAAVARIFDRQSKDYDYVLLAQTAIDIVREYRAVFFDNTLHFAYEKSIEGATFTGNLSPLHWESSRAIRVEDEALLKAMSDFVLPALQAVGMTYGGIDLALDAEGTLWCIELNSSPGFDVFIRHCGDEAVVALFCAMLQWLARQ